MTIETFVQSKATQYPEISCALHNSLWQSAEADAHTPSCYSRPDVIKIAVGTSPNQKIRTPPDTLKNNVAIAFEMLLCPHPEAMNKVPISFHKC